MCGFIIPRPVPWEWSKIVVTLPLPNNIRIHIGNCNAKWLDNEIGWWIAIHLYPWRPVTWGFFLNVFWIYPSSGRAKEGLGRWNTYRCIWVSSSYSGFHQSSSFFGIGQPLLTRLLMPWDSYHWGWFFSAMQSFQKWHFWCQITIRSTTMIDWEMECLGAGALLGANAYELGNYWDVDPHFIFYLLCCQATLILPNSHSFCCTMADCKTGVLGADSDL